MLIDTHCHLSFKAFDNSWPEVVKRAREKDIQMICVGAAKDTSEKAIAIAEKSDGVFAAIGLHPTHAEDESFDYEWFSKAADNPKVVAIGETGIDYYHLPPHPTLSPQGGRGDKENRAVVLQKQEDLLRQHLVLAKEKNLPVILHCRDHPAPRLRVAGGKTELQPPACATLRPANAGLRVATAGLRPSPSSERRHNHPYPFPRQARDRLLERRGYNTAYEHLYRVIKDFGYTRCVLHCFGGGWTIAQKFLDLGCLLSFTGIVTYQPSPSPSPSPLKGEGINTKVPSPLWGEGRACPVLDTGVRGGLHEVVRNVPLDRFMIETDSPYLAPEPYRGQPNEPAYVEYIARAIAEIRGISYDDIAQATTENAKKFFGL